VLLTQESAITFRRRYQSDGGVAEVLDLLLLDPANPRSLSYQVQRLREALAAVPGRAPEHLLSDVVDLLAELDTVTAATTVSDDGRRTRLAETLESVLWRLRAASDEIERAHFVRPVPSRPLEDVWDA
jgi:uncharacterized alpha-E superfamily protein